MLNACNHAVVAWTEEGFELSMYWMSPGRANENECFGKWRCPFVFLLVIKTLIMIKIVGP